jgi:hypothetical protein
MENYIQAEDFELWMLIKNGPLIPTRVTEDGSKILKKPEEFDSNDYKMMEKNAKAKKLLYFGLGPDEYTRISECESAKDIWDALQVAHEGTNQVKQSRIELLMRKYELFEMGDRETVMDMYTRFTHITNELKSLGKSFTTEELVRKILRFLPHSWEAKVTAIQEAKDMKAITLDELIGNLQTYELRRNSQQKEEIKRDRGLALKALEEEDSDLDEEVMAMFTRKFKKLFKKAKENAKRKNFSKARNSEREQFTGCFRCGKHDHIVKNCPLLKEEQEQEQFQKQGRKQGAVSSANRSANRPTNSSANRLSKAMIAAWGDSTEEDDASEEEEVAVALMARSESDSDDEPMESLAQLKEKVSGLSKTHITKLLFTFMDEYESINSENCMLKDSCSELKRNIKELEHENKILKSEKIECDMENTVLHEDLNKFKESLSLKEKAFATDFAKLENESLELKQKVESLLVENRNLLEKLKQVETDLAANRCGNRASQALNWLNTHHNRNKKGLGFVKKSTVYPANRKYVGLPENIVCFHCGKTGHYRYSCPSRKYAIEKNLVYVRQIWVRKDELHMFKRMGPKCIWVPKTNL